MKIYFCGSIRGGREDAELYAKIIEKLKAYGEVLTEHVGDTTWTVELAKKLDDKQIYETDINWLTQSDVVVAEVTQTSTGVGYELGYAAATGKRTLCLFRPSSGKMLSAMVRGAHDDKNFIVKDYKESDVDDILKGFLGQ